MKTQSERLREVMDKLLTLSNELNDIAVDSTTKQDRDDIDGAASAIMDVYDYLRGIC